MKSPLMQWTYATFKELKPKDLREPKCIRLLPKPDGHYEVKLLLMSRAISCSMIFPDQYIARAAARTAAYLTGLSHFIDYSDGGNFAETYNAYIYFVAASGIPMIKIGQAEEYHLRGRLSSLQTGCPLELNLMGFVAGVSKQEERYWQNRFSGIRVRNEWFNANDELVSVVTSLREWFELINKVLSEK